MGSSRAVQEAEEIAEAVAQKQNAGRRKRELENKLKSLDAQIAILSSEFEVQKEELNKLTSEDEFRDQALVNLRSRITSIRKTDEP
jgi:circadian clock protein KaiC